MIQINDERLITQTGLYISYFDDTFTFVNEVLYLNAVIIYLARFFMCDKLSF